ncbi:MAG: hypothetical protein LBS94_02085 [Prevotellaceae bacterium]|jgi:hypothetical protein|nr:hypothetical protein [Prevotellaceae bacterium]
MFSSKKDGLREFEDVREVGKKTRRVLSGLVKGNRNFTEWVRKNFGFMLFLVGFGFLYITHHYWVDNMAKEKQRLAEKVRSLKEETIVVGARLTGMHSQASVKYEVERRGLNLMESTSPPTILMANDD